MASCNNVNHPHQSVILSLLPYSFEALPFQPVLALLICFNPAPILTQHLPKTPLNKHLFPLLHLVLQHLTPLDHTPPPFHDSRQPSHSQWAWNLTKFLHHCILILKQLKAPLFNLLGVNTPIILIHFKTPKNFFLTAYLSVIHPSSEYPTSMPLSNQ
jgi:hypothetical protein